MRLFPTLLALTLTAALGAPAQGALRDGDLVVPIPDNWVVWSTAETAAANPDVPEGHTVVGMAGEHPLGHPAPQATVTLERLDLRQMGMSGADSTQLAEMNFVQMRRDAPTFEPEGSVFPTRLGSLPAHGWQGVLPFAVGERELRIRVWQTIAVRGDVAHVLTFYLPEEITSTPRTAPASPETAAATSPELAAPASPEVSAPPSATASPAEQWRLGTFTLPMPEGWALWSEQDVAEMRTVSQRADRSVADVNGITRPAASAGDFQASVAAAALAVASPISSERLVALTAQSAQSMAAGTLSAEITLRATPFQMAGRLAAIAVIEGAMMDRGALRPVRIDQLWIDGGDTALRFVVITDLDDEAARQRIGEMLAALRD